MLSLFGDEAEADDYFAVAPEEMPAEFRRLLVHDHHMTVTLETHYASELGDAARQIAVRVHEARTDGDLYLRKVTLRTDDARPPVLAGLVRFDLRVCTPDMRAAIVAGRTPLGHLLIRHHRMRAIEPGPYWRVEARERVFGLRFEHAAVVYGRLATIHCDGVPALRLLEVVTRV